LLADRSGSLHFALLLPAICYGIIAAFGVYARRPAEGPVMQPLTA
jgi:FHS family L-fucose permease-like MFS transporter